MKSDRLYAITVYLLNHGRTSAAELARHFEVSVRTVQRDIDSLCLAGIPIAAIQGSNGGYEISGRFKLDSQFVSKEDFSYIAAAVKGLNTAMGDKKAHRIYEKLSSMSDKNDMGLILDFSVLREGDEKLLQSLQSAVLNKNIIRLLYTNVSGETKLHNLEPIAVIFRWYAWYLLAYSYEHQDYRTYKLVRMKELEVSDRVFSHKHKSAEEILEDCNNEYRRNAEQTLIKIRCESNAIDRIKEYLNADVIKISGDGWAVMEFNVIESEQWWIGFIMSLGKSVEILEPEHIRKRVLNSAREIISLYQ